MISQIPYLEGEEEKKREEEKNREKRKRKKRTGSVWRDFGEGEFRIDHSDCPRYLANKTNSGTCPSITQFLEGGTSFARYIYAEPCKTNTSFLQPLHFFVIQRRMYPKTLLRVGRNWRPRMQEVSRPIGKCMLLFRGTLGVRPSDGLVQLREFVQ